MVVGILFTFLLFSTGECLIEIHFNNQSSTRFVQIDDTVVFLCPFSHENDITWVERFDSQVILYNQSHPAHDNSRYLNNEGNLVIDVVAYDRDSRGRFSCLVGNDLSSSLESAYVNLTVFGIPNTSKINLVLFNSTLVLGSDIYLICEVYSTSSMHEFRWYLNGTPIVFDDKDNRKFGVNGIKLKLSVDRFGQYVCQTNTSLTSVREIGYKDLTRLQVVHRPVSVSVVAGDRVSFDCVLRPASLVYWTINNNTINRKNLQYKVLSNNTLVINSISPYAKSVQCTTVWNNLQTTLSANINVSYIGQFYIESTPDIFIEEDGMISIKCHRPVSQPPADLSWIGPNNSTIVFLTSAPASENVVVETAVGYLTLTILKMTKKNEGTYSCIAKSLNIVRNESVHIHIKEQVEVRMPYSLYNIHEGNNFAMTCLSDGQPTPSLYWQFANGSTVNHHSSRVQDFLNGTVLIRKIRLSDLSWELTCIGRQEKEVASIRPSLKIFSKLRIVKLCHNEVYIDANYTVNKCPLRESKRQSWMCLARSLDMALVSWYRVNSTGSLYDPPLVANRTAMSEKYGESVYEKIMTVLTIENPTRADEGRYACVAEDNYNNKITTYVEMIFTTQPVLVTSPSNVYNHIGDSAEFECRISATPSVSKLTWYFISSEDKTPRELKLKENKYYKFENKLIDGSAEGETVRISKLTIKQINETHVGEYYCVAGNAAGFKKTDSAYLTINNEVDSGSTLFTIIVAIIGALLYILLMFCLTLYCRLRRSRNRRNPVQTKSNGTTAVEEMEVAVKCPLISKHHFSIDKLQFPRQELQTISLLGRGVFGDVFLAKAVGLTSAPDETIVLVKSQVQSDENIKAEFYTEIEKYSALNHQNICKLLGVCTEMEPYYMILEYPDWGDLKKFLHATGEGIAPPLSLSHKLHIISQILNALDYLDLRNLVHKDVAARNCHLTSQLAAKLSSASLCKDAYRNEYYQYHERLIPLRWMPIEAIFDDSYSTASDVYAWSILIWEVFSLGQIPYESLSDADVLKSLIVADLQLIPPPDCPTALKSIMSACLSEHVSDRPSTSSLITSLNNIKHDSAF